MSIWKEIRCDRNGENCYDNENNTPHGFENASILRARGKKAGWRRVDGDDVCPACMKEPQS